MPRVHYVKAAKDYPDYDIKKGDMYYYWKFRTSSKRSISKTRPRQSQLTTSDKLSRVYGAQEDLEDIMAQWDEDTEVGEIEEAIEACWNELESVKDEYQDSLDNMPEPLQEGPTGQEIQEKIDSLDNTVNELQSITVELPEAKDDNTEEREEAIDNIKSEIEGALSCIEF